MGRKPTISWCLTVHKPIRMEHEQFSRAKKLIRRLCANYDAGNCLLLDDGDACPCPQLLTASLICRYFRNIVLPSDPELRISILYRPDARLCALCGALFLPASNRAKYCRECAAKAHRRQKAECERRRRSSVDN